MTKWTPGPWVVTESTDGGLGKGPLWHYIETPDGSSLASTWNGPNLPNANLIAAAPDLYDSVCELITAWEGGDRVLMDVTAEKARAVLRKARGE